MVVRPLERSQRMSLLDLGCTVSVAVVLLHSSGGAGREMITWLRSSNARALLLTWMIPVVGVFSKGS